MSLKDNFKKASNEIANRMKYLRGDKGQLETKYQQIKNAIPKDTIGEFSRIAKLSGIDLLWFLFCLTKFAAKDLNTIFLDNKIIDKWREDNKKTKHADSKFKQWLNEFQGAYPTASARLKLWVLYGLVATMVAGGIKLAENGDNEDINSIKKERVIDNKKDNPSDTTKIDSIEVKKDDKIVDSSFVYDVTSESFEKDFINKSWNEIVISLLEMETWREKPKLQSGESRYTYGPGLTWVYTKVKNKKGEFIEVQNKCAGNYVKKASNFTMDQIWDQVKRHSLYRTEVMPVMKRQLEKYGFKELSEQQVLGLFVAGYQLPGTLTDNYDKKGKFISNGIIHNLHNAGSKTQKQVDAFIAGKEIKEKYRVGTNKRRWWCAMIYIGKITTDDLLELNRDSFSAISINTVLKNGHFVYDDATIKKVLSEAKKTSKGSVKDFIKKQNVPLKGTIVKHNKSKVENDTINPSMEKVLDGDAAFNTKDYKNAIKCYTDAISLDEDNMEAYSSLALAYKKLGDQTHSISDYESSLQAVKACNARMNKNKSLLHDPEIKAATYYNAGLAREEIAKLQIKANNIAGAIENYVKAKQNFVTAYNNAEEAENAERMILYKQAQKRMDDKVSEIEKSVKKKDSFKAGQNKIVKKQTKTIVNNKNMQYKD